MKQIFLFFFTLVVATMGVDEHFVEKVAVAIDLTTEEVQECMNETSLTLEDVTHFGQILRDDLDITDSDDKATKMGCFFACLGQKKEMVNDAQINVEKVKEIVRTKLIDPDRVREAHQAMDTCGDQVKNIIKKCEASLKFMVCYANEMQNRLKQNNNNNNESNNNNEK